MSGSGGYGQAGKTREGREGKGSVALRFCIPLGRARRGGAGEPRRYGWRVKDGHVTGQ